MKYKLIKPEVLKEFKTNTFIDFIENQDEIEINVFNKNNDLIIELLGTSKGSITIFDFGKNIFSKFVKPAYDFTSNLYKINIEKDYQMMYFHLAGFPDNPIILENINHHSLTQ